MASAIREAIEALGRQSKAIVVSGQRVVVKDFAGEPGIVKWALIKASSLAFQAYPLVVDPLARMEREVRALRSIEHFRTPKIFAVDYKSLRIAREYVEGESGFEVAARGAGDIGASLAGLHDSGWALGDTKVDNFVLSSSGQWYLIDAEQAIEGARPENMLWDLLVFLSTLILRAIERGPLVALRLRGAVDSFADAYVGASSQAGEVGAVAANKVYRLLAYLLLPYPYAGVLLEKLKTARR